MYVWYATLQGNTSRGGKDDITQRHTVRDISHVVDENNVAARRGGYQDRVSRAQLPNNHLNHPASTPSMMNDDDFELDEAGGVMVKNC